MWKIIIISLLTVKITLCEKQEFTTYYGFWTNFPDPEITYPEFPYTELTVQDTTMMESDEIEAKKFLNSFDPDSIGDCTQMPVDFVYVLSRGQLRGPFPGHESKHDAIHMLYLSMIRDLHNLFQILIDKYQNMQLGVFEGNAHNARDPVTYSHNCWHWIYNMGRNVTAMKSIIDKYQWPTTLEVWADEIWRQVVYVTLDNTSNYRTYEPDWWAIQDKSALHELVSGMRLFHVITGPNVIFAGNLQQDLDQNQTSDYGQFFWNHITPFDPWSYLPSARSDQLLEQCNHGDVPSSRFVGDLLRSRNVNLTIYTWTALKNYLSGQLIQAIPRLNMGKLEDILKIGSVSTLNDQVNSYLNVRRETAIQVEEKIRSQCDIVKSRIRYLKNNPDEFITKWHKLKDPKNWYFRDRPLNQFPSDRFDYYKPLNVDYYYKHTYELAPQLTQPAQHEVSYHNSPWLEYLSKYTPLTPAGYPNLKQQTTDPDRVVKKISLRAANIAKRAQIAHDVNIGEQ